MPELICYTKYKNLANALSITHTTLESTTEDHTLLTQIHTCYAIYGSYNKQRIGIS